MVNVPGWRAGPAGRGSLVLPWVLSVLPFVVLATANSAGYRYGASDLAFYGPAVMRHLDPELFPRDRPVIDAQAHLTFMDETVGTVARLTTTHLPTLFLGLYLLTLVLLTIGISAIGASLYERRWTVIALLAAMTLRHAITKSGTNSLEGYFHPRQLAFALGMLALAAFLRGRLMAAALALCGAASLHPTTTLWLGIWLAVATFVARPEWRLPMSVAGAALLIAGVWTLTYGPLGGRLTLMDAPWLAALGEKDYLFPLRWPITAWLTNVSYVVLILWLYARRRAAGIASVRESGLVAGCLVLAATFAVAVALNAARVALAIQLQPARIFWMLDVMATVYVVWGLAEGSRVVRPKRPVIVAASLIVLSVIRGAYVMRAEFPNRPLFETGVPGDWGQVAQWAETTPKDSGWLADPGHAARYGTSLRMAAARDVFVEGSKDAAIGMYDRGIALRTQERLARVRDFPALSAEQIRELGGEYGLDYMVSEAALGLPLVFQSGAIRVYRIR